MQQPSKVLIVYTGGTIGMVQDADSKALHPFDFSQVKQEIPELGKMNCEIDAVAFTTPIDSSDMGPKQWNELADIIQINYDNFCGFVILHGTDTMSYTASALSFMLEGLNKPVVLTGSQLPIGVLRTDGKENLLTAIEIAGDKYPNGNPKVGEVAIYFEYKLMRGNRTHKTSASHFDAFFSPNFRDLAEAGINIEYKNGHLQPFGNGDLNVVHLAEEQDIIILPLFPGMSEVMVSEILQNPNCWAILMITFGAGNATTQPWFVGALKNAAAQNKIIINITQCDKGRVDMSLYQNGKVLQDIGVISGSDITSEAALAKLMYLKQKNLSIEEIKAHMQIPLRGEMTI